MACPASEFDQRFLDGMLHRMAVSFHRYGPVADAFPHKVDALRSMADRVAKYQATGNTEFLIDAANFLMIEFMLPANEQAHFKPTDSQESPGRRWHDNKSKIRRNDGER